MSSNSNRNSVTPPQRDVERCDWDDPPRPLSWADEMNELADAQKAAFEESEMDLGENSAVNSGELWHSRHADTADDVAKQEDKKRQEEGSKPDKDQAGINTQPKQGNAGKPKPRTQIKNEGSMEAGSEQKQTSWRQREGFWGRGSQPKLEVEEQALQQLTQELKSVQQSVQQLFDQQSLWVDMQQSLQTPASASVRQADPLVGSDTRSIRIRNLTTPPPLKSVEGDVRGRAVTRRPVYDRNDPDFDEMYDASRSPDPRRRPLMESTRDREARLREARSRSRSARRYARDRSRSQTRAQRRKEEERRAHDRARRSRQSPSRDRKRRRPPASSSGSSEGQRHYSKRMKSSHKDERGEPVKTPMKWLPPKEHAERMRSQPVSCRWCKGPGHNPHDQSDCPNDGQFCHYCKSRGHIAATCPNVSAADRRRAKRTGRSQLFRERGRTTHPAPDRSEPQRKYSATLPPSPTSAPPPFQSLQQPRSSEQSNEIAMTEPFLTRQDLRDELNGHMKKLDEQFRNLQETIARQQELNEMAPLPGGLAFEARYPEILELQQHHHDWQVQLLRQQLARLNEPVDCPLTELRKEMEYERVGLEGQHVKEYSAALIRIHDRAVTADTIMENSEQPTSAKIPMPGQDRQEAFLRGIEYDRVRIGNWFVEWITPATVAQNAERNQLWSFNQTLPVAQQDAFSLLIGDRVAEWEQLHQIRNFHANAFATRQAPFRARVEAALSMNDLTVIYQEYCTYVSNAASDVHRALRNHEASNRGTVRQMRTMVPAVASTVTMSQYRRTFEGVGWSFDHIPVTQQGQATEAEGRTVETDDLEDPPE